MDIIVERMVTTLKARLREIVDGEPIPDDELARIASTLLDDILITLDRGDDPAFFRAFDNAISAGGITMLREARERRAQQTPASPAPSRRR